MVGRKIILHIGLAAVCFVGLGARCTGSTVWTQATIETIPLNTASLSALEVRTHNGSITFVGGEENEPVATVTKKGGGATLSDAEDALASIEVFVEPGDAGLQKLGWRWKTTRRSSWSANVSFDIRAPRSLDLTFETHNGAIEARGADGDVTTTTHNGSVTVTDVRGVVKATTHNGSVEVSGITGDVRLTTHNGGVEADSAGGAQFCKTHNGAIVSTYSGDAITLETHNGSVKADVTKCGPVGGSITTHNGSVKLFVGDATSTTLNCETHRGAINCEPPLADRQASKRRLSGVLGEGGASLDVQTHNGSIHIGYTQ
ncbi:MAG: DUF4097 family beta strand repeat protein [Planctomycetes bacterium]|nr:DUF4097 family beta strand repeat protein [Planctomycetota bacterium]